MNIKQIGKSLWPIFVVSIVALFMSRMQGVCLFAIPEYVDDNGLWLANVISLYSLNRVVACVSVVSNSIIVYLIMYAKYIEVLQGNKKSSHCTTFW